MHIYKSPKEREEGGFKKVSIMPSRGCVMSVEKASWQQV